MANAKTMRIRAYFRALARDGVTDLPNPFIKVPNERQSSARRSDLRTCSDAGHNRVRSYSLSELDVR